MASAFEGSEDRIAEDLIFRSAVNADRDAVRELIFGVLREYGLVPDPEGIDSDLDDIEASYISSGGLFNVLEDGTGNVVGTVGLFPVDEKTVELRKMYLDQRMRGRGLGKATLQRAVGRAAELGFEQIILETASVLKEAIGLYSSFGFKECEGAHADRCDRAFYLELGATSDEG